MKISEVNVGYEMDRSELLNIAYQLHYNLWGTSLSEISNAFYFWVMYGQAGNGTYPTKRVSQDSLIMEHTEDAVCWYSAILLNVDDKALISYYPNDKAFEISRRREMKLAKYISLMNHKFGLEIDEKDIGGYAEKVTEILAPKMSHIFVEGDEVVHEYRRNKYDSCMYRKPQTLFYAANKDVISQMIILNSDNQRIGRALVWKTDKGTFLDRVYPVNGGKHVSYARSVAKKNGWFFRRSQTAGHRMMEGEEDELEIRVKVKDVGAYPFMDTMTYARFCTENGERYIHLSNKQFDGYHAPLTMLNNGVDYGAIAEKFPKIERRDGTLYLREEVTVQNGDGYSYAEEQDRGLWYLDGNAKKDDNIEYGVYCEFAKKRFGLGKFAYISSVKKYISIDGLAEHFFKDESPSGRTRWIPKSKGVYLEEIDKWFTKHKVVKLKVGKSKGRQYPKDSMYLVKTDKGYGLRDECFWDGENWLANKPEVCQEKPPLAYKNLTVGKWYSHAVGYFFIKSLQGSYGDEEVTIRFATENSNKHYGANGKAKRLKDNFYAKLLMDSRQTAFEDIKNHLERPKVNALIKFVEDVDCSPNGTPDIKEGDIGYVAHIDSGYMWCVVYPNKGDTSYFAIVPTEAAKRAYSASGEIGCSVFNVADIESIARRLDCQPGQLGKFLETEVRDEQTD